jgi:hypothetical protein
LTSEKKERISAARRRQPHSTSQEPTMRRSLVRALVIASLTVLLHDDCSAARPVLPRLSPAATPLLIADVTVLDVRAGKALPGRHVLVEAGRIKDVSAARPRSLPAGCRVIDGRGKFLLPGLWDMHGHCGDSPFRPLLLAAGVTGMRHMFAINPLAGDPRRWNSRPGPGGMVGPRVVATRRVLDGPGSVLPFPVSLYVCKVHDEASARKAVRSLKKGREDFIKVYSLLSRQAFAAAADEARKQEMDLVGHVPLTVTTLEAVEAGMRSIEHLGGITLGCSRRQRELLAELAQARRFRLDTDDATTGWRFRMKAIDNHDPRQAAFLFRRLVQKRTWVVPTLTTRTAYARLVRPEAARDPRWAHLPRLVRAAWTPKVDRGGLAFPLLGLEASAADLKRDAALIRHEMGLVRAMQRAGVGLLAGTDAPYPGCLPGFAVHDELALLVEAGLSPAEALRTATLNPARFFGWQAELGTVEKGKRADLVLLDGNPLDDINHVRKVRAVLVAGHLLDRAALDALLKPIDRTKK